MKRPIRAGVLPVLLLVASAEAQASQLVTEDEFLAALDERHPAVVASSQALAEARARIVDAAAYKNPGFAAVYEDPEGPGERLEWTASWELPSLARRPEIASHEQEALAAEARQEQVRKELRAAMKEVYAEWAFAAARREMLASQAERVEALAERSAHRVERGESAGIEAQRLKLAAAGLRARVALADADVEAARADASAWMPDLDPEAVPMRPALPEVESADEEHPLVRAELAELEAAKLERRAVGKILPAPTIAAGMLQETTSAGTQDGLLLGLSFNLPLFDRNRAEQALADARIVAAEARLESVRRRIDSARPAAVRIYERLVEAHGEAEAALVGGARMLRGVETSFLYGETGLTDLLDAFRAVADAEMTALDLHEAALSALRELEQIQ